ncbi:MAG: heme-binding protein [Phenylobacterium sp.]|uniref:SOUL family heme-binding protein n=1 Tax=Phenylobacterium sp. TaxID=1871053 RepID=UPI001B59DB38|nr:heme-binding protein [Phenylobacterium sp.]MBP7649414.1 heme-binding protein [Phenylobacterium sp.]MBP7815519.1 heme-binding protein [Phenylobacterium sp.]MBP9232740.1 heme-binding protein [Phenylobacterium sp.]MBP9754598.1 heme-binding protein [Phenylobacterium sp.]
MANAWELGAAILGGLGALVGIRAGTEQPRYTVVERLGAIEIRHYAPRLAAEATVSGSATAARSAGFEAVAGYIFGGNTAKASIAMTAPVAQSPAGQTIAMTAPVAQTADGLGSWKVQFIMPARYTAATLPVPTSDQVTIVELPAQDYAVLRFSGARGGPAVERRTRQLTAALSGQGWQVAGTPTAWFYDPPWTPSFLRRNEVAAPVVRSPRR